MTAKNHVATTFVIAITPALFYRERLIYFPTDILILILAGMILGSLLPDIDEENSYIGRKLKFFSSLVNFAIGHRTITHNIFVWCFVFAYGYYMKIWFLVGVSIGSVLHILEDSATNNGVKWALKPIARRFAILPKHMRFKTDGNFENYIYTPLIIILLVSETIYMFIYFLKFLSIQLEN